MFLARIAQTKSPKSFNAFHSKEKHISHIYISVFYFPAIPNSLKALSEKYENRESKCCQIRSFQIIPLLHLTCPTSPFTVHLFLSISSDFTCMYCIYCIYYALSFNTHTHTHIWAFTFNVFLTLTKSSFFFPIKNDL